MILNNCYKKDFNKLSSAIISEKEASSFISNKKANFKFNGNINIFYFNKLFTYYSFFLD